ncbi:hypothetical protein GQR58_013204 [Nymphon striatum]|nr:hypothetical protein GQR58_013204 [Nymphon striatum]
MDFTDDDAESEFSEDLFIKCKGYKILILYNRKVSVHLPSLYDNLLRDSDWLPSKERKEEKNEAAKSSCVSGLVRSLDFWQEKTLSASAFSTIQTYLLTSIYTITDLMIDHSTQGTHRPPHENLTFYLKTFNVYKFSNKCDETDWDQSELSRERDTDRSPVFSGWLIKGSVGAQPGKRKEENNQVSYFRSPQ